jgi:hypothetical protein
MPRGPTRSTIRRCRFGSYKGVISQSDGVRLGGGILFGFTGDNIYNMCILEVFLAIGVEGRREALHGLAILIPLAMIPFINNMIDDTLYMKIYKNLNILK